MTIKVAQCEFMEKEMDMLFQQMTAKSILMRELNQEWNKITYWWKGNFIFYYSLSGISSTYSIHQLYFGTAAAFNEGLAVMDLFLIIKNT